MASAINVAKYFLMKPDPEAGDLLSNLKLQKLLYYAQGFHLALFDAPLFDEHIEAWRHGPVVRSVYAAHANHGRDGIPPPENFDPHAALTEDERELLDDVYRTYGQFSAWRLREMTHAEPPWANAWNPDEPNAIARNDLRNYFSTLIEQD